MQEIPVLFLGQEDLLEKGQATTPIFLGFTGGSDGKESACNAGDLGLILGLGRSPGGEHGNPLQHSCLENPYGQRSLVGYSPWGCKESDTTEQLPHTHTLVNRTKIFLIDFSPFFLLPRSLVNCPLICPQTTALVCQDQQCLYYRLET